MLYVIWHLKDGLYQTVIILYMLNTWKKKNSILFWGERKKKKGMLRGLAVVE